jgi:hypothetical protein
MKNVSLNTKKLFQVFCIIVTFSAVKIIGAAESSAVATSKASDNFLTAFVSFETYDQNFAIIADLMDCIKQKIAIICAMPTFVRFMTSAYPGFEFEVFENRKIIESPENSVFVDPHQSFVVSIPEQYYDGLLQKYGFNPQLMHIEPEKINNYFKSLAEKVDLDDDPRLSPDKTKELEFADQYDQKVITNFKHLFEGVQQMSPKIFLISGHGSTKFKTIANVGNKAFGKLLITLNELNTKFVYILSCHAGGPNIVELQQELDRMLSNSASLIPQALNYPIVIRATTDVSLKSNRELINQSRNAFKRFFEAVKQFVSEPYPQWYFGGTYQTCKTTFTKLLRLIDSSEDAEALSSVRFPGTHSFFRAIDLNNMAIITWLDLQKIRKSQQLEERFLHRLPQVVPIYNEVSIPPNVHSILIYPCDLTGIRIKIDVKNSTHPHFISKIPGTALHVIGSIHYNTDFTEPSTVDDTHFSKIESAPKAWFIETVNYVNTTLKGFVSYKGQRSFYIKEQQRTDVDPEYLITYQDDRGQYNLIYVEQQRLSSSPLKSRIISADEYSSITQAIAKIAMPNLNALKEASGGNETLETVQQALQHFFAASGIAVSGQATNLETIQLLKDIHCPELAQVLEDTVPPLVRICYEINKINNRAQMAKSKEDNRETKRLIENLLLPFIESQESLSTSDQQMIIETIRSFIDTTLVVRAFSKIQLIKYILPKYIEASKKFELLYHDLNEIKSSIGSS